MDSHFWVYFLHSVGPRFTSFLLWIKGRQREGREATEPSSDRAMDAVIHGYLLLLLLSFTEASETRAFGVRAPGASHTGAGGGGLSGEEGTRGRPPITPSARYEDELRLAARSGRHRVRAQTVAW